MSHLLEDLAGHARFMAGLGRFLRHPISLGEAEAEIRRRLEQRDHSFVAFMEDCVFANPASPYLPLLREAGCTLGDIASAVERHGIEGVLEQLREQGVWLSADEYKGHTALRRELVDRRLSGSDFDNLVARGHIEVSSGGSGGAPRRTHVYLRHFAERACYDRVMFRMLGLEDAPIALWYPTLPAVAGMSSALRYAKIGYPAAKWFRMLSDEVVRPGLKNRTANRFIVGYSKLFRHPLPTPQSLGMDQVDVALEWILRARDQHGRCGFQTYVSQAVRVCAAAAERSIGLEDVHFIVGSEPLTEHKSRRMRATGARVYPRYMSSELGSIGMGCGDTEEVGSYHLLSDRVTAIVGGPDPAGVGPLLFTSFSRSAPKVLLNVQIGDRGRLTPRACACRFNALGLDTHVSEIESETHVCVDGMAVRADLLTRIVDEVLPRRFGGVSTDYQWVERESPDAESGVWLRIHPRVGPLEEGRVVDELLGGLRALGEVGRLYAGVWESAGSVHITRDPPRMTPVGKAVAIFKESSA